MWEKRRRFGENLGKMWDVENLGKRVGKIIEKPRKIWGKVEKRGNIEKRPAEKLEMHPISLT
jgi:hypothetical protein